ncbi:hypothetical protein [Pedobacter psychroterrae]|uniref:Uncharacterized protein n=1 Tax=Pedobacter psychroterrae TaxID=2530453 RepID=A0A4R0NHZ7_9SPHI|nr:hypothetical protein [Pedobacter psychroterrae]TCC98972.1 hypothetical protein EZ437_17710 [Pedobacter psychroterrae]
MVLIFKTSIGSKHDLRRVTPFLNALAADMRWTVDIDDCDRILRVESGADKADQIALVLSSHGFLCINLAKFYAEPEFS